MNDLTKITNKKYVICLVILTIYIFVNFKRYSRVWRIAAVCLFHVLPIYFLNIIIFINL